MNTLIPDYEQKLRGDREKYTDDIRLRFIYKWYSSFPFSFLIWKKEIINLKPKDIFILLFVSAIHGSIVLETYLYHCACISLLTERLQH